MTTTETYTFGNITTGHLDGTLAQEGMLLFTMTKEQLSAEVWEQMASKYPMDTERYNESVALEIDLPRHKYTYTYLYDADSSGDSESDREVYIPAEGLEKFHSFFEDLAFWELKKQWYKHI